VPFEDWPHIYSAAVRPPPSRTTNHESRNLDSDNIGARRGKADSRIPYETRFTVTARSLNEKSHTYSCRGSGTPSRQPRYPRDSRSFPIQKFFILQFLIYDSIEILPAPFEDWSHIFCGRQAATFPIFPTIPGFPIIPDSKVLHPSVSVFNSTEKLNSTEKHLPCHDWIGPIRTRAAKAAYLPESRTPNPEISPLTEMRLAVVRLIPENRVRLYPQ